MGAAYSSWGESPFHKEDEAQKLSKDLTKVTWLQDGKGTWSKGTCRSHCPQQGPDTLLLLMGLLLHPYVVSATDLAH